MSDRAALAGRAAIVTGSTSGIGLAIAEKLAALGCNVVICGSRSADSEGAIEALEKVAAAAKGRSALADGTVQEGAKTDTDVASDGGIVPTTREKASRVTYVQADLRHPEAAAKEIVGRCAKLFGGVHILVNNAGIQHVSPTDTFPAEKWDDLIAVNLTSCFHTIQQALPYMKKNEGKWGRIVNVSSVHGVVASVNKAAYVAAKHGLNGLTKVVALENAADTLITCNAVCPGWVLTPLVEKQINARAEQKGLSYEEAVADLVGEKQPTKRFTSADQIADMCVFLCSESASNMTGTINVMDGAWHVQ